MLMFTVLKSENKDEFSKYVKYVQGQAPMICKGMVSHRYITGVSLKKMDGIIIAMNENKTRTRTKKPFLEVEGFILMRFGEMGGKKMIYVDVICARKVGKKLLNEMYEFARRNKVEYIQLSALPHVINFYKKERFVHSEKGCIADEKTRKVSDMVKGYEFKDFKDVMKNRDFVKFLEHLRKQKLVANKKCTSVAKCSEDGYTMTRCI